ncbi:MAG: ABC transporter substrate-binding protein [Pseudomonadota bacterium]
MPRLTRREFVTRVYAGATVIGLSHLLDPTKALAATPDTVEAMVAEHAPKTGGILTYGPTYPNWALGQSNRGEHRFDWLDLLTRSVWTGLTSVDEELELASGSAPSDDFKVWGVTLREGVLVHDGTECTAADVLSRYRFLLNAGNLRAHTVSAVEQTGPYTVRFFLDNGTPALPHMLAEYRNMIMRANDSFDGIGTGPFRRIEIDTARQFRSERFEDYWTEQGPVLDELPGVIALGNAGINGFRSGRMNAVFNIDPGRIEQCEDAGGEVFASPAGDQFSLVMPKNLGFPWNDVRVRKAMSLAIDRPAINRIVYNDPEGWTGNDCHMTGVNAEFVVRDVAQARALLAEAGYADGVTLPAMVVCPSFPEEPRLCPIVSESLAEAGVNLEVQERPCHGFTPFVNALNQPIGRPRRNLVGPRSPNIDLSRASELNAGEPGGWAGEGVERSNALLAEAAAETDDDARFGLCHEMQRIAQDEGLGLMIGGRRINIVHREGLNTLRAHTQLWQGPRYETVCFDA